MNYNRTILILAITLGAGLTIEGLKRVSALYKSNPNEAQVHTAKNFEIKPFQVSAQTSAANNLQPQSLPATARKTSRGIRLAQVGAAQPVPANTVATPSKKKDANKADKNKKKTKKKKSAQELARKKKEKELELKRQKERAELEALAQSEDLDVEEADETPSSTEIFLAQTQVAPEPELETETDNGAIPIGYSEWAKLILRKPNPKAVTKLVNYYNGGLVSGEIFYNILGAMMGEQNNEQHLLAVSAARRTPNPRSFVFLAEVLKSDADSKVQTETTSAVNDYTKVKIVSNLRAVLSSEIRNTATLSLALDLLDRSTNQYIDGRGPAEETNPTNPKKYARVFNGFKTILEKIVQTYEGTASIQNLAQRSLDRIKSL